MAISAVLNAFKLGMKDRETRRGSMAKLRFSSRKDSELSGYKMTARLEHEEVMLVDKAHIGDALFVEVDIMTECSMPSG